MEKINAPWDDQQVKNLNDFQFTNFLHPFTCPNSHYMVTRHVEEPKRCDDYEIRTMDKEEFEELERENNFILWPDHVRLVAFLDGWRCPAQSCDYRQDWSWKFMADGSWREDFLTWQEHFLHGT